MFYVNSDDTSTIPDSLFFLHKIGLVNFQKIEGLSDEEIYLIENGIPQKVLTPEAIDHNTAPSKTVIIFNFILSSDVSKLLGHNVIFIPHVYFDYISAIKNIFAQTGLKSFKIYTPETNTMLIPKKHLKIMLPFLKDTDFFAKSQKTLSIIQKENVKFSYSPIFYQGTKVFLSAVLDFSFKPVAHLKLLFGMARVALIKIFYFFYNLRFPLKHHASVFYWLNIKFTFYPLRKFRWIAKHEYQKRILKNSNVSKR